MVAKAKELVEQNGWFYVSQFANPANPEYHANTTGSFLFCLFCTQVSLAAEILSDFRGVRLDYFVSGWGTGGTLAGCAKTLKTVRPDCKIVCVEPAAAPLLSGFFLYFFFFFLHLFSFFSFIICFFRSSFFFFSSNRFSFHFGLNFFQVMHHGHLIQFKDGHLISFQKLLQDIKNMLISILKFLEIKLFKLQRI